MQIGVAYKLEGKYLATRFFSLNMRSTLVASLSLCVTSVTVALVVVVVILGKMCEKVGVREEQI